MTRMARGAVALAVGLSGVGAGVVLAQAVAEPERARPVAGDPGISSMVALNEPQYRVLRDYAEPGATRRMHAHPDATYQVFVLITGRLRLTVEGQAPIEVGPGEVVPLAGGVRHTFTNIGTVTATIVEVFGKAADVQMPSRWAADGQGNPAWAADAQMASRLAADAQMASRLTADAQMASRLAADAQMASRLAADVPVPPALAADAQRPSTLAQVRR